MDQKEKGTIRGLAITAAIGALVLGFFVFSGIRLRARADSDLRQATGRMSAQSVHVMRPKSNSGAQELVVPGNIQAFVDTPIWARADGYLKAWYIDIGAHVHTGQLLAEIESPETIQQLHQVRNDLASAQANLKLAELTAERYSTLLATDSVAKQDVDNAVQASAARLAAVHSAEANVKRLEQVVSYQKIYAPFSGVVTARNIDTGALVNAGANTPGRELFHLASISMLRVYVSVPQTQSRAAKPGVAAYLTLTEYPARKFQGVIARQANAIDPASRTLLVEVDVKNTNEELLPGAYASVHLSLPSQGDALAVPVSTLLFRSEGLRLAVVRDGKALLLPVTLGRDFGEEVEIVAGLGKDDLVILNPSDSLLSGQPVNVLDKL